MYPTKYHKPGSVPDAVALLAGSEGAKILSGGQTLLPTMKQHLAAPGDLVDVRGIAELNGICAGDGSVTIGAATRHMDVATSARREGAYSGAGRIGERDRRSGGARHGHARRLRRQQRPGGGLPGGGAGAGCHRGHQQARDRGRRLLPGHVHHRPGGRRDRHRHSLPGADAGGLFQVPQSRLALCHGGRFRGGDRRRGARGGDRCWRGRRVPARRHGGGAVVGISRPVRSTACRSPRTGCSATSTAPRPTGRTSSRSWPSARWRTPAKAHEKGRGGTAGRARLRPRRSWRSWRSWRSRPAGSASEGMAVRAAGSGRPWRLSPR